jgi:glycosyltransferase involved in cell wall biosynthesis
LNREVIVVDDASTDGTTDILRDFGDSIRLIALEKNQGAPAARNTGAAAARGDYLVYLDGDDLLKPWALSVYDLIVDAWKPVFIVSSLTWFQGALPSIDLLDSPNEIDFVNYKNWVEKDRTVQSSASIIVVRRQTLEKIGGWKQEAWPFDDQYLAAELAHSGRTIQILKPATVFHRQHEANASSDVSLLIEGGHHSISAWKASRKNDSETHNLASAALVGGPAFFAVKRAFRTGQRREGLRLFGQAWPFIAAAVLTRVRRSFVRRDPETMPMQFEMPANTTNAKPQLISNDQSYAEPTERAG